MSVEELYQRAVVQANQPRRVSMDDPVDEAVLLTVIAIGEPLGRIDLIGVRDVVTGIDYSVYPEGVQAYCTPGAGNLGIVISWTNAGTEDGTVFVRVIDDTGAILAEWSPSLRAGEGTLTSLLVDMPMRDYGIAIECGH